MAEAGVEDFTGPAPLVFKLARLWLKDRAVFERFWVFLSALEDV